jgi:hypothetical protein
MMKTAETQLLEIEDHAQMLTDILDSCSPMFYAKSPGYFVNSRKAVQLKATIKLIQTKTKELRLAK